MQASSKLLSNNFGHYQSHQDKKNISPHKLSTTKLSPRIQTHINPNDPLSSLQYHHHNLNVEQNRPSCQNYKKILILDDSVIENNEYDKQIKEFTVKNGNKTTKKQKRLQPLNPFQQILHQYDDTPDFNMTLPFVDDFSKIDMKSPTFSDVFNFSELKSPQTKLYQQPNKFFIAVKKCQKNDHNPKEQVLKEQLYKIESKQIMNLSLKLDFNKIKKDLTSKNETSFISEIKISKPLQTPKKKISINKQNSAKPLTPVKIMSQQMYKLHQNPLTPKIKNISFLNQQKNQRHPSENIIQSEDSVQSNPQIEGKFILPYVSYSEVKNKISPRLQQSYQITDNLPAKRSYEDSYKIDSYRQEVSRANPYKRISIKKLQLEEQLQKIYNGKFKLNRTMRF